MNPRIQFNDTGSALICSFDREAFRYDRSDKQSRRAALAKLDEHGTKVIAALETQAGRPLSNSELIHGVVHIDDRSRDEKVAERITKQMEDKRKNSVRQNPYQAALDSGEVDPPRKETKREMYARNAGEWDAKQKTLAEQRERAMDQARQRHVKDAECELLAMRYDPKITLREMEQAESRLELAREGDLFEYCRQARDWQTIKQARIDGQSATIDEQIRDLQKRKADIKSAAPAPFLELPMTPAVSTQASDGQWTNDLNAHHDAAQGNNQ